MNGHEVTIGSRGSRLALAQAQLVRDALTREGTVCRIEIIETDGDRRPPDTAWGEGAFVAAIELALLAGRVDVAVHSAKDVPTDENPRLVTAAYLPRADPRDALVVRAGASERSLDDLPAGARVGTDSPRRTGFVLARRPDLNVHPLHGNVDTRLRRLDEGQTDALVLACAGLDRMELGDRIAERLDPEMVPPAPGQGAIAVQIRRDDPGTSALVGAIDNRPTRQAVETERSFLRASGGGCRAPIGALATVVDDEIDLFVGLASPDGSVVETARRRGPAAEGPELGGALARDLARVVHFPVGGTSRANAASTIVPRVIVTRAEQQAEELVSRLRLVGLDPVPVPTIAIEIDPPRGELDRAAGLLHTYQWVVVTSTNGARAILTAAGRILTELGIPLWAAIGPATSAVLEREGIEVQFRPSQSNGMALADELPIVAGDRALVVRGDLAGDELASALRARGAEVDDVVAYRTREAPESSRGLLRAAIEHGPIRAVLFTSGSTVRGLRSLGLAESIDVRSLPGICIGRETADEALGAGFRVLAVSPRPDAAALAAATADALALDSRERS